MIRYKKIIAFLLRFFLTYFILLFAYKTYLNKSQQVNEVFKTSSITTQVADHTIDVLNLFGFNAVSEQHTEELSVKILIEDNYVSRVIEGCNSISLIILFIAFIIAFSGKLKATVLFLFSGALIIYVVNILRISLLSVFLHKYPGYQEFLHNLVFPAIIYGTIFLLWVLWVNKFSNIKNE